MGPSIDLLPVLGVLYLGPRIDRFHLPLLLYMPCDAMLLFCCLRTFTILYCFDNRVPILRCGHSHHLEGLVSRIRRRRKPLGPSTELGADFVAGSLVGWPPVLALVLGDGRV